MIVPLIFIQFENSCCSPFVPSIRIFLNHKLVDNIVLRGRVEMIFLSNQDGSDDTRRNHSTRLDPSRLEQISIETSLFCTFNDT